MTPDAIATARTLAIAILAARRIALRNELAAIETQIARLMRGDEAPCMGRGDEMTPEQRSLARHALGLDGKRKQSYRNRFVTGPGSLDHPAWAQMVAAGMARQIGPSELFGGDDLFVLTAAGATAALAPGETLCPEDFPRAPVEGGAA